MIEITDNVSEADAFLALHNKLKKNSHIEAVARSRGIPIFITKSTSLIQITKAMRALVNKHANVSKDFETDKKPTSSEMVDALEEARLAIEQIVIRQGKSVELLPRPPHIIPIQVGLINEYKLKWEMVEQEPTVYLRIFPLQSGIGEKKTVDIAADGSMELNGYSNSDGIENAQNGFARLPFLPE